MTEVPSLKLGYVVIESEKIDEWYRFAADGLGLHVNKLSPDLLAMRVDDRERRLLVQRGPAEDVVAIGWETDKFEGLEAMRSHLVENSVELTAGSLQAAAIRGVESFVSFPAHKGLAFEFFSNAMRTNQPLFSKTGGFVTGAGGLGHVVLFTRTPELLVDDMKRLLGARLSDTITDKLQGLEMRFWFLHLNERHHSLAVAATEGLRVDPLRTRIQHMMLEAVNLNDVSDAYERCKQMGYRIAMGMGQHPNDLGVSFYVVSPSGFEVELGYEPRKIGDDWQVKEYRGISKWGHKPEYKPRLAEKLEAAWRALKSIFEKD
tara:strand:- start:4644 stop:5597 length:954 start_codon:yes stop_codon:yes gene_type:complete